MTIVPNDDFDIMDFLMKRKNEIKNRMGFDCEIEVELGSEWVYLIEGRFNSWISHYKDEMNTIFGMPLRINYKNPHEIKIWANGAN